jgi:hypothetical protein
VNSNFSLFPVSEARNATRLTSNAVLYFTQLTRGKNILKQEQSANVSEKYIASIFAFTLLSLLDLLDSDHEGDMFLRNVG